MDKEAFKKHTKDLKAKLEALKKKAKRTQPATCEEVDDCLETLALVVQAGGGPIGDE